MELAEAWNKRSSFPYNGNNKNGYYLPQTLVRYMASKGLTKDRDGMSQMTDEDVRNVENGVTNYRYTSRFSLKKRVYEIIWELHMYFNGANPSGFSISQRIEFLKCALSVIESNELWGVGTGDIREEMNRGYQVINSKLEDRHFLPHNQYVTIMVRFGFVGLMLFMTCFIFSIILEKKHKDYLVVVYLVTVLVSMLNEDTLETQYGIIFFAFWGALLVFGYRGSSSPQHPSEVIYERENDDTRVLISRKND
jgi:hypothetical protein